MLADSSARGRAAGIAAGVIAGAFWGLVFLAPKLARGFVPLQLSAGRYLAYGLVAAALAAPSWHRLRARLDWRDWRRLAWLAFSGNILYYVLLAEAVQQGGVAMTAFVIGLLPLAVTLVAVVDPGERHALPLRRLVPSLVLSLAGLACIGWQTLAAADGGAGAGAGAHPLLGLLCAGGALASWTSFAVSNSRWLARLEGVSSHNWSLLTGVVTGAQALLLALPAFALPAARASTHTGADWVGFGLLMVTIALFCSVLGNALWNFASRTLPLALTGQLIVFETVFAALYGFLWEKRWPTSWESLALALLVAGVVACAHAHRPAPVARPTRAADGDAQGEATNRS